MMISYKSYNTKYINTGIRIFQYKNRITRFNLIVPAAEAKVVAPLSPILGQFGLSCQEFCTKFNAETEELLAGIPLRLKFTAYPQDREFKYKFLGISFVQLLSCNFGESLNILDFYKINLIYKYLFSFHFKCLNKKYLMSLIGCLKSLHMNIRLFYN
jgi:hypothetical protein